MQYTPDAVFRKMENRRIRAAQKIQELPDMRPAAVYVPQNVRAGSYRQLMQSHDRMGTRHLR